MRGVRETVAWVDEIYFGGFGDSCIAIRWRNRVWWCPVGYPSHSASAGDVLTVLRTVVSDRAVT